MLSDPTVFGPGHWNQDWMATRCELDRRSWTAIARSELSFPYYRGRAFVRGDGESRHVIGFIVCRIPVISLSVGTYSSLKKSGEDDYFTDTTGTNACSSMHAFLRFGSAHAWWVGFVAETTTDTWLKKSQFKPRTSINISAWHCKINYGRVDVNESTPTPHGSTRSRLQGLFANRLRGKCGRGGGEGAVCCYLMPIWLVC